MARLERSEEVFLLDLGEDGNRFTPDYVAELVRARLQQPQVAHRALVAGERFSSSAALAAGVVDEIAPEADVVARAIERAQRLAAKDPATFAAIERGLYRNALEALRDECANHGDIEAFEGAPALIAAARGA